jgi:protein-S-isoprenylcysteine O-methyltransferase Ste14
MSSILLITSIAVWGAVHSWLAASHTKALLEELLGTRIRRWYRLSYNALAVLTFVPVLALLRVLPDRILYAVSSPWLFVLLGVQATAAFLLLLAFLQTSPMEFLGLRQVAAPNEGSTLVTTGFYGLVRHPLYLFGFLIMWLTPVMTTNLLAVVAGLSLYLFIGAKLEEQRLLEQFGPSYREYRARTPMILPLPRPSRRP